MLEKIVCMGVIGLKNGEQYYSTPTTASIHAPHTVLTPQSDWQLRLQTRFTDRYEFRLHLGHSATPPEIIRQL